MDEFVRVLYPTRRAVKVDDAVTGETNQLLILQSGHHRFSLGGGPDFDPPFFETVVADTLISDPLVVRFTPIEMLDTARIPIRAEDPAPMVADAGGVVPQPPAPAMKEPEVG